MRCSRTASFLATATTARRHPFVRIKRIRHDLICDPAIVRISNAWLTRSQGHIKSGKYSIVVLPCSQSACGLIGISSSNQGQPNYACFGPLPPSRFNKKGKRQRKARFSLGLDYQSWLFSTLCKLAAKRTACGIFVATAMIFTGCGAWQWQCLPILIKSSEVKFKRLLCLRCQREIHPIRGSARLNHFRNGGRVALSVLNRVQVCAATAHQPRERQPANQSP